MSRTAGCRCRKIFSGFLSLNARTSARSARYQPKRLPALAETGFSLPQDTLRHTFASWVNRWGEEQIRLIGAARNDD
jgi:hypothetical protein